MRVDLPYATVRAAYPALVQQLRDRQRASTSVHRDAAPEALTWRYDYGVQLGALDDEQVLARLRQPAAVAPQDPERAGLPAAIRLAALAPDAAPAAVAAYVDARLAARRPRLVVSLVATRGRAVWGVRLPAGDVPAEVLDQERAELETAVAEERRVAALTPEARRREADQALQELRGQPGFVEVRLGPQGLTPVVGPQAPPTVPPAAPPALDPPAGRRPSPLEPRQPGDRGWFPQPRRR